MSSVVPIMFDVGRSDHRALRTQDVLLEICQYLTFIDLAGLRQVNHFCRLCVNYYIRLALSLPLAHFVSNPLILRSKLFVTNAILSGSYLLDRILQATRMKRFLPKDLDVYCPFHSAAFIVDYFRFEEGYIILSCHPHDGDDYGGAIFNVIKLFHPLRETFVDVICSTRLSAILPVAHFWATHVMNVMTANTVSIAYPLWTLKGLGCITRPGASCHPHIVDCLVKYYGRHFWIKEFYDSQILHNCGDPGGQYYCPHRRRSFPDSGCLTFTFDDLYHEPHAPPIRSQTFSAEWILGGPACGYCAEERPRRITMSKVLNPF